MTVAWVFPGQGSQKIGMAKQIEDLSYTKERFSYASEIFERNLFEICSFYFFAINKSVLICFLSWSTFLNFFSFLINFKNSTVKYLLYRFPEKLKSISM